MYRQKCEGPAATGMADGAGSNRVTSRDPKHSAIRSDAQCPADRIATYDGRRCIGSYTENGAGRVLVFGADGVYLGSCGSRREAQTAIYRAFTGEAWP